MSKIQIKRYNGSTTSWENQFPVTKAQNIVKADGTTAVFDGNDKINIANLPDAVFDSLYYAGTTTGFVNASGSRITLASKLIDDFYNADLVLNRDFKGHYYVISITGTISDVTGIQATSSTNYSAQYVTLNFRNADGGQSSSVVTSSGALEVGDWFVIDNVSGAGTVGSPWVFTASIVSNTYENATSLVSGIVRLSSSTVAYGDLSGTDVITEARLKTLIDSQNFTNTSHTHLLAAGATDVTATASELNLLDGELITTTELNYLSGVTSAIQTQLNGKAATSHTHSVANISDLTATATELNYTDGVTSAIQTQLDAKAALAGPTFTGTVVLPSTTSIGTISSTELGYLDGVTSAIQTQFGAKANLAGPTFTGTVVLPSTTSIGNVDSTEIGYLDGVTSAIQTQLNAKQATITGGATTIVSSNLTASRALASDGSGKVAVSAVTATELGYLSGVTSAIQTQLTGLSSRVRVYYDGTPSGMVTDDIWFDAV
jgi:hypothetical protein